MRTGCLTSTALDAKTEVRAKWKGVAIGTPLLRMVYFGAFRDGKHGQDPSAAYRKTLMTFIEPGTPAQIYSDLRRILADFMPMRRI